MERALWYARLAWLHQLSCLHQPWDPTSWHALYARGTRPNARKQLRAPMTQSLASGNWDIDLTSPRLRAAEEKQFERQNVQRYLNGEARVVMILPGTHTHGRTRCRNPIHEGLGFRVELSSSRLMPFGCITRAVCTTIIPLAIDAHYRKPSLFEANSEMIVGDVSEVNVRSQATPS
eukprot:766875-Hanusia_phi.AAC.1